MKEDSQETEALFPSPLKNIQVGASSIMKQMSENKRLGPMHPNPYFVDEKTEVGLLTTSHQSLSEMSHHLFTYRKMMPWFLQVLRSRMS